MKNVKGITLIALVITIVVLIILAGVAISLSLGENGIFNKAKFATEEYANEQAKEETEIGKISNEIESHVGSSRETTKPKMKVLFNGSQTSGTITFAEDTIDDYDYYEFIFGVMNSSNLNQRVFSQTVSKQYLQMELNTGGIKMIGGAGGTQAIVSVQISDITENAINFNVIVAGTSWSGMIGGIYQIIGRNM